MCASCAPGRHSLRNGKSLSPDFIAKQPPSAQISAPKGAVFMMALRSPIAASLIFAIKTGKDIFPSPFLTEQHHKDCLQFHACRRDPFDKKSLTENINQQQRYQTYDRPCHDRRPIVCDRRLEKVQRDLQGIQLVAL